MLREAVAKASPEPLELLIKTGDYYEMHMVEYHGGERYPHLLRNTAVGDLMSQIIAPRTK